MTPLDQYDRRLGVMLLAGLLTAAPGAVAPAAAQSAACEPWVSHVFNNAVADKVNVQRAATVSSDPCGAPATAFQRVDEYAADSKSPDHQEVTADVHQRATRARLNEIVIVRVQHLQTLWDRANCIDRVATDAAIKKAGSAAAPASLKDCRKRDIHLFIDSRPIAGLTPESGAPDVERRSGTLRYHLKRTEESKEHWADLLGLDLQRTSPFDRHVRISVGLADGDPIPTAVTAFKLVRIRGWWLAGWILLAGIALWMFFRWARRTDLLRDRYAHVERGLRRPFSLAHCQGAWWTLLTLFSLVFIWLVTGQRDFSGSALALLGITAGTAVGARLIDASRPSAALDADPASQPAIQAALTQKKQLEAEVAAAEAAVAAGTAGAVARLNAARDAYSSFLQDVRRTLPGLVAPRSNGFFRDILSDAGGISFHRFQMVAWAAILGVMFAIEVLERLAMPQFDTNLLALMGISSGTYLGLKIPEKPVT